MNRTLRRAAERKAQKLAVNANKIILAQQAPTARSVTMFAEQTMTAAASVGSSDQPPDTFNFQDLIDETKQASEARMRANRANAQHSTGPRTEEGKAKSSMNAVKTGLTGRTVLLPIDDAVIYQQHLDRHFAKYSPANDDEHDLVQCIADTEWRLLRIMPLEASIYAIGRLELADQFPTHCTAADREALMPGKIFMTYRKDLSNLALQERRLRSQRKADIAELQQLQQARIEKQQTATKERQEEVGHAINLYNQACDRNLDFDPAAHGFDFSIDELQAYGKQNNDRNRSTKTTLDFDQWLATYRAAQKEPEAA